MTDKVWDLANEMDIAMFVTRSAEGTLHGRPMSSIPKKDEGRIYFLTETGSAKNAEIATDNAVNLSYAAPGKYLSVTGTVDILDDRVLVRRLWNPGAQAFWPEGPESGKVAVLAVTPHQAEFWEGPSGFVAGIKFAFALLTKSTPDMGENARIKMSNAG